MGVKGDLEREFIRKFDPWIPYEGPYGGAGWQNVNTGEIRYQEAKPGTGEAEGEEPTTYQEATGEEPEGGFDRPEELEAFDMASYFDEGDSVELDGDYLVTGEDTEVEITDIDEEEGTVTAALPEGGEATVRPQNMTEASQQSYFSLPPEDGWADGWSERPEDPEELTSGQKVEVYDFMQGDYVVVTVDEVDEDGITGRVTETEEWTAEDSAYEVGDTIRTDVTDDKWVTAQEDVTDLEHADKLSEDELLNLQEGDEVYYNDPHRAGLVEAEVASDPEMTDEGVEVEIMDEDDLPVTISTDDGYNPFFEEPTEIVEPSEVPLIDLENPEASHWPSLEGTEAVFDHPMEGEVEGEVEYGEDEAGGEWLSITPQPDPDDLEEGDRFHYNGEEYKVEMNDPYALDAVKAVNDSDFFPDPEEVSWDKDHPTYDTLKDEIEGEPVSVSTNPEHPYYVGDVATGVEQPYQPIDSVEADDLKIGDTLVDEETNSAVQIEQTRPGGEVLTSGGEWVEGDELNVQMDYVQTTEGHDPPDNWDGDEWLDPMEVNDQGNATPREIYADDTVYYYDEEAEELKTGRVSEPLDDPHGVDFEVVGADGPVSREQMQGVADTGIPLEENYELWELDSGYEVEVQRYDYSSDEVETMQGYVAGVDEDYGEVVGATVMLPDGEPLTLNRDMEQYAISEVDKYGDPQEFFDDEVGGDWQERSVGEITEDLYTHIDPSGHGNYLSKIGTLTHADVIDFLFDKSDQSNLRAQLMTTFPAETVNTFYDGIDEHKASPEEGKAGREVEAAFKYALDIEERVRDTRADEEYGRPADDLVKLAEVAAEMSQWYYEDHIGPSTDYSLTRDASQTSFRSFLLEWADNPDAEEFGIDGRATNKFQISPGTWNYWRASPEDVPTGDVALATDFMFNPMENNSNEDEIWLTTNETTVSPENIGVGPERTSLHQDNDFGGPIDEWDEYQTAEVGKAIAENYEELTKDEHEVFRPGELTDTQVETFLDLVNHAEELGVTKSEYEVEQLHDMVTSEAQARGMLETSEETLPTGISSIEDFQEGMHVSANDMGEEQPFVVEEILPDGTLNLRNYDTDKLGTFEPSQVTEIVEADETYGPAEQAGEFEVEDFTPGKQAYAWTWGGRVEDVTVIDTDGEDNQVRVSRPSGRNEWYGVDRLVPGDADLDAEGSDEGVTGGFDSYEAAMEWVKDEYDYDETHLADFVNPETGEVETAEFQSANPDDQTAVLYDEEAGETGEHYTVPVEHVGAPGALEGPDVEGSDEDGEDVDLDDLQADTDFDAMSPGVVSAEYEQGDPIGIEWPTIDETAVGEVVEVGETIGGDPSVTVSYEIDGNQQVQTITGNSDQNLVPATAEGSDEPAPLDDPEDVEEGMEVVWTPNEFDGPDDGHIGEVEAIDEFGGIQVYDEDGEPHALDIDQIRRVPDDWGAEGSEEDTLPSEGDTLDTPGFTEPVEVLEMDEDDGVLVVQDPDGQIYDYVEGDEHYEEMVGGEVIDQAELWETFDTGDTLDHPELGEVEVTDFDADPSENYFVVEDEDGEEYNLGLSLHDDPSEEMLEGSEETGDVDHHEAIEEELEAIMPDDDVQPGDGPVAGDFQGYDYGKAGVEGYDFQPVEHVDDGIMEEGQQVALVADYDYMDDKMMYVGESYYDEGKGEWKIDVQNHDEPDYNFETPVNENDVEAYIMDEKGGGDGGAEGSVDFDETNLPDNMETAEPESFTDAVEKFAEENPDKEDFLSFHDPSEFEDHDLFVADDGSAGVAVSDEGDIQNVFSGPEASVDGDTLMETAIEAGGKTLDCYDGFLRDFYESHGFEVTGTIDFNPEYAPEGWEEHPYLQNEPNVLFMAHEPEGVDEPTNYDGNQWSEAKAHSQRAAGIGEDDGTEG